MRRPLCALVLLLAAVPLLGSTRWWEPYKKGLAAVQASDWATVVSEMEKAITLKRVEELSAKAGRSETLIYIPHFWLGVARYRLGDVEGALRAWDVSQGQGVIQRTQHYADLQSWRARAAAAKTKSVTQGAADSRKIADTALKRALTGQISAVSAGADRLDSYRAALRKLQEAREQFNQAGADPNAYRQAAAAAAQAEKMFAASAEEAKERKARTVPRPVQRQPVPQVAQTSTRPAQTPASVPPSVEPPPAVEETQPAETSRPPVAEPEVISASVMDARLALEQFRRRLADARGRGSADPKLAQFLRSSASRTESWTKALGDRTGEDDARAIEREIAAMERTLSERLEALSQPPSSQTSSGSLDVQLLSAFQAFAAGKVDDSEQALSGLISSHPKSAEAYLLRGCARYTRAMTSKDERLLAAAAADFAAALKISPRVALDSRYFSPKLVSFLDEVRRKQK